MAHKADLVVLVSGSGTNLQALLDASSSGELNASISAVISNKPDAFALERAANSAIPTETLSVGSLSRQEYDLKLAELVSSYDPDLVVLAGWNRILSSVFLSQQLVINLHPALPATFTGLGCIEKAFEAWQAGEATESGVMIHWVPDEGVDTGPVITTRTVQFQEADTLQSFEARMHEAEHLAIVEGVGQAVADLGIGA